MISEKIEPANLFLLFNLTSSIFVSSSKFNSGVTDKVISSTGAIAVITPDNGLVTSNSFSLSFHFVFIDKESFPTGIDTFKSMLIFDNASTPSRNAISCCSSPEAAIQLADTWT